MRRHPVGQRAHLRFGIQVEDDFAGNSVFNAATELKVTELDALGGEWRNIVQIGDTERAFTELYQPIDANDPADGFSVGVRTRWRNARLTTARLRSAHSLNRPSGADPASAFG